MTEGNGRFAEPDQKDVFTIAPGSVRECVPPLEVARRRGFGA